VTDWSTYWENSSRRANSHAQVGRTLKGEPISDEQFKTIIVDVEEALELHLGDRLLDLCCGNGMITEHLAGYCASVTAVDMVPKFITDLKSRNSSITALCADIRQGISTLNPGQFDKVLIYFSLQYFTQGEVLRLLSDIHAWLKPGGILLAGDIPDVTKIWKFFNSAERKQAYFNALQHDMPIIGTWFNPSWLVAAAEAVGFKAGIRVQPSGLPNSHYRFDLKAVKCS
jgi:cyclopropane fatty-acyl-phospholipid synthase-like methyltransferase